MPRHRDSFFINYKICFNYINHSKYHLDVFDKYILQIILIKYFKIRKKKFVENEI